MRKHSERVTNPAVAIVHCSKCEAEPMRVVAVKPLLLASGVEEIHYRCRACGSQELRIVAPERH
jgi:ribosomal protein L40E